MFADMTPGIMGLRIIESEHLTEWRQRRFPRSRRRRVRRKWERDRRNWAELPSELVCRYGDHLVCHPEIARRLARKFSAARIG